LRERKPKGTLDSPSYGSQSQPRSLAFSFLSLPTSPVSKCDYCAMAPLPPPACPHPHNPPGLRFSDLGDFVANGQGCDAGASAPTAAPSSMPLLPLFLFGTGGYEEEEGPPDHHRWPRSHSVPRPSRPTGQTPISSKVSLWNPSLFSHPTSIESNPIHSKQWHPTASTW
jgi:hypothetical protein